MGILNTSTGLLSSYFLREVRQLSMTDNGKTDTNSSYKISVIKAFEEILRKGFNYGEIQAALKDIKNPYIYSPWEIIPEDKREEIKKLPDKYPKEPDELIHYTLFYYHPLLQETRKPASYIYDDQSGEIKEAVREPYFLEIVDSFTMRELVNYFMDKMELTGKMQDTVSKRKGLATEFYKYNHYSLDMLLYLIDAADIECQLEDIKKPHFVEGLFNFSEQSEELYRSRRNILDEKGGDKIVPRSNTYY